MASQTYQEPIMKGVQGLPGESLAEIANFIYFMRRRATQPRDFAEELQTTLLKHNLRHDETTHLEQKFANYDQLYPRQ